MPPCVDLVPVVGGHVEFTRELLAVDRSTVEPVAIASPYPMAPGRYKSLCEEQDALNVAASMRPQI